MWGFTVDDALVSVRYAMNLAAGEGYRFSRGLPSTDGVTPLPWAPLLALLAAGASSAWAVLVRAKIFGVVAYGASLGLLGREVGRSVRARASRAAAYVTFAILGLAFPVGAWAASGMETGLVVGIATCAAAAYARPARAAMLCGLAAALRPELLPWALVVACGAAIGDAAGGAPRVARRALFAAAIAGAPFVACALVRQIAFGRPVPLAVLAKPSDLEHGATYALAASVVVLLPLVVAAPRAILAASPRARTLSVAFVAHVAAVALAGGDWMPFARLIVPVVPSLVLVAVDAAPHAQRVSAVLRALVATALGTMLVVRVAPSGRDVMRDREELVTRARPALARSRVVAALDIGWVSAACDARIVDLAGLTDPSIAVLRGGHTSKRVDVAMLLDRDVDTVVVYGEPRAVEERLVQTALFEERFERAQSIPFGTRGASYVVYARRAIPR